MNTTNTVRFNPLLVLSAFIEFIFKPFIRRHRSTATPIEAEIIPVFENDARETVRELVEGEATTSEPDEHKTERSGEPEVKAPLGICLRKSVLFRTNRGEYRSAKVVGYDGEDLILSRKNGPRFRRRLSV